MREVFDDRFHEAFHIVPLGFKGGLVAEFLQRLGCHRTDAGESYRRGMRDFLGEKIPHG